MIERGQRDIRPFGTRRPADRTGERADAPTHSWAPPPAGAPGDPSEMPGWEAPRRSSGLLPWALRTAAVAGLGALFAAQYLSHLSGPGEAPTVRVARGPLAEPETTGSIGRPPADAARGTRLDPCAVPPSPRQPRP